MFVVYFMLLLLLKNVVTLSENEYCGEVSEYVLEEILGPAYNSRYMSIHSPTEIYTQKSSTKRRSEYHLDFYVDDLFENEDTPAWEVTNHVEASLRKMNNNNNNRFKRSTEYMQEWHCKSRLKWTDLGPDYFPRYLRSVDCLAESCWFKIYKCRPRSFTVKILRRKKNKCVIPKGHRLGITGLPAELKQLWVWEERPVSFCCDCTI